MSGYKIGFIGCGRRSTRYLKYITELSDEIVCIAVADPNERHREIWLDAASEHHENVQEYSDWQEMLRSQGSLDGVVIATPNHLHADMAVECLRRGMVVALEKPLATTREDCERILEAEEKAGTNVLLGFVLRSTPFYRRIHDIVRSGKIGEVVAIEADELVNFGITKVNFRGKWRRHHKLSGGSLLEKSCHDMDIFNWIVGSRPVRISSFGGLLALRPDKNLPEHCDECSVRHECPYRSTDLDGVEKDSLRNRLRSEDTACIYNIDKSVNDTQSIQVLFDNGAVVNFLLTFNANGPATDRSIHVIGTKGRIWGRHAERKVTWLQNKDTTTVHEEEIVSDGSGHGGGDRTHVSHFVALLTDRKHRVSATAYDGYLAAVMCFSADASIDEKRQVGLKYAGRRIEAI